MYFPDPYTIDFALCIERCPYYYVRDYYCIYDEDHFTLRFDWPCYDSLPSTTYGKFCLPFTESARKEVLDYLYEPLTMIRRGIGTYVLVWDAALAGMAVSIVVGFVFLIGFKYKFVLKVLLFLAIFWVLTLIVGLAWLMWRTKERVSCM